MDPIRRLPPAAALRRWRRRRQQRGAAVFVIVLVITLLSALGIWASRSATLVDMATGHSRHALQVQYLADMGLQSTTAFLANGLANEFVRQAQLGVEVCTQGQPLEGVTARNPFCYPFFSHHLNGTFASPLLATAVPDDGENSLGPYGRNAVTPLTPEGQFVVEMTDLGPAPPCPGCEVDDVNTTVKHGSVVLTSIATIFPDDGTQPGVCQMTGSSTSGRQMMRAQAVVGPLFQ